MLPSLHWTNISHPWVVSSLRWVPHLVVTKASCCFSSLPSVRWSTISSNRKCLCPYSSTCANRIFAMEFTVMDAFWPSWYSTSYILVSSIELWFAVPVGSPFISFKRLVTLANSGWSPFLESVSSILRYVSSYVSGVKVSSTYGISSDLKILSISSLKSKSRIMNYAQSSVFGLLTSKGNSSSLKYYNTPLIWFSMYVIKYAVFISMKYLISSYLYSAFMYWRWRLVGDTVSPGMFTCLCNLIILPCNYSSCSPHLKADMVKSDWT